MITLTLTPAGLTLCRHLTTPIVANDAATLATAIRALIQHPPTPPLATPPGIAPAVPAPCLAPAQRTATPEVQLRDRLTAARRRYL